MKKNVNKWDAEQRSNKEKQQETSTERGKGVRKMKQAKAQNKRRVAWRRQSEGE